MKKGYIFPGIVTLVLEGVHNPAIVARPITRFASNGLEFGNNT